MSTHTLGEWFFDEKTKNIISKNQEDNIETTIATVNVYGIYTFPCEEQGIRNGYLLAASKELLEMARDYKKNLEWLAKKDRREGDEEGYRLKMLSAMRVDDLIKRATGETMQDQPCSLPL